MNNLTFIAIAPAVGLTFSITAAVLAVGLTCSMAAMAESMSDDEYKVLEKNIEAEYLIAMQKCNSKAGSYKVLCDKNAKVARDKNIENSSAQMQMKMPKADLLKNKKPIFSNSMKVIDELPANLKKSRLM